MSMFQSLDRSTDYSLLIINRLLLRNSDAADKRRIKTKKRKKERISFLSNVKCTL